MQSRDALLDRLEDGAEIDVLIVGGGINGVGLYRDLAAQGCAALLVEREDFGAGTSAAPSRLIHGGLRYLETGEFALVRESVEERNLLLRNAPHTVTPIPVWLPLVSRFAGLLSAPARFLHLVRKPGHKGAIVTKIGLLLYDWMGKRWRSMPRHRMIAGKRARAELPGLAEDFCSVAEYYDARISHPERLVAELVADAESDQPRAMAIPYLAVAGCDAGAVVLRDVLTDRTWRVAPKQVVNTAGAWADRVNALLGIEDRLIGGTKGSHLVVRSPDLAARLGARMLYFETFDQRLCLIYRLDGDLLFLGTTDLRCDEPDLCVCSEEEIDYIFDVTRRVLPGARLDREDIVLRVSGVRPLPLSKAGATGAISRDHSFKTFPAEPRRPFPVITLVGGKWTTYRACAAQLADDVLAGQGEHRRSDTRGLAIGGGRDWPEGGAAALTAEIAAESGLGKARVRLLVQRYGSGARQLAETIATQGDRPLASAPSYCEAEIAYLVRQERVTRLTDIALRRSLMAFEGLLSDATVAALAEIAGRELGWDAARRAAEIDHLRRDLSKRNGIT
ncbi:MAG: glycerol-3-phosphate dehydrogenase/oxidase [Rhodospirillales bacterium]